MRAFIALEIPGHIKDSIVRSIDEMGLKLGVKPVPSQNMHITLEFLGEISDSAAARISEAISSTHAKKFTAKLGEVSTFGASSSVAFVGLSEGRNEAAALQQDLHGRISALQGIKGLGTREFFPHVSIARGNPNGLNELARRASGVWKGSEPFTVSTLALKRSIIGGAHAVYEPIFEKELS